MLRSSQRLELVTDMLKFLFEIQEKLSELKGQIETTCRSIYMQTYDNKLCELDESRVRLETNLQKIQNLNNKAIHFINEWHQWSNNNANRCSIAFPVKYLLKKKKVEKSVSRINREIVQITIDNRLIQERLASWEIEVKRLAEIQINESDPFRMLNELLFEKKKVILDLEYLLSTMPEVCPIEIDLGCPENLNRLLSYLKETY